MTATVEPKVSVMPTPVPVQRAKPDEDYEQALRQELEHVLPPALVNAAPAATADVQALLPQAAKGLGAITATLASALAPVALEAIATLLTKRLTDRGLLGSSWLRQILRTTQGSQFATMTEFSARRNRYVKAVEGGAAVFLTRRGVVVAALVPVRPGEYEEQVYKPAMLPLLAQKEQAPPIELTEEQISDISQRGAVAAREYGIDTTNWVRAQEDHTSPSQREHSG